MNKAFEKILERLEEYEYNDLIEHNSELSEHCKRIDCENGTDCSICVMNKAKEIVQEVAEEYNGGWIPCSERLPEEKGKYLTTSKIYFVPDHVDDIDNYIGIKISGYSTRFGWYDDEVIAWMPLPEPYKESD